MFGHSVKVPTGTASIPHWNTLPSFLTTLLPTQLSADMQLWRQKVMMAQVLGSLPCPQEGDLDQVLGFKPQPSPALPVAGIWEMKKQMEDLCLSNKT